MEPMGKNRENYHHGDLAQALLRESLELIREKGLGGLSIREAARRLDVDPAAVYRHYRNKADILQALSRWGYSELARSMEKELRTAGDDPEERFSAVGRAYIGFAAARPELFTLMFGEAGTARFERDSIRGTGEGGRDPYEILLDALEELEKRKVLRMPAAEAALPAWSLVHGFASLVINGALPFKSKREMRAAAEQTIDALRRGLEKG